MFVEPLGLGYICRLKYYVNYTYIVCTGFLSISAGFCLLGVSILYSISVSSAWLLYRLLDFCIVCSVYVSSARLLYRLLDFCIVCLIFVSSVRFLYRLPWLLYRLGWFLYRLFYFCIVCLIYSLFYLCIIGSISVSSSSARSSYRVAGVCTLVLRDNRNR